MLHRAEMRIFYVFISKIPKQIYYSNSNFSRHFLHSYAFYFSKIKKIRLQLSIFFNLIER